MAKPEDRPLPLRVLIIEDKVADAELMLRELQRAGFTPEAQRIESREALEQALGEGSWDVVLADYTLPSFSGLEAMEPVRAADPDMPFILVTGTVGEEIAVASIKEGVDDYILKANIRRLGPAVRREVESAALRRRHRAEQEAERRRQANLREMIEGAIEGICVFQEFRPVLVNRTAVELFGFSDAATMMMVEDSLEFVAQEFRDWVMAVHNAHLVGQQESASQELRLMRNDGAIVWVEALARGVEWEGKPASMVTFREITARKAAEQQAELASTRLDNALTHMVAGLLLFDADDRLVLWNKRYEEQLPAHVGSLREGMPYEEVIRMMLPMFADVTHDPEEYVRQRVADFHNPPADEIEQQLNDGRWLLLRDWKTPDGDTVSLRLDITPQKRAQEALRQQQWLLQAIFDNLPLVVYVLNAELRFEIVNLRMAELQQLTPQQMVGLRHADLQVLPEQPRTWLHEQCAMVLEQDEPASFQDVEIGRRGVRPRTFNIWIIPLHLSSADRRVLVVGSDTTDQRLLQQQFATAQRMESAGRLAGGIAHDFNNMLSVIISYASFLKEAVAGNEEAEADAETILDAANRSALLTRQLLAFSRRQIQKLEPVNINDELRLLEKMLARLIGEDIRIHMNLAEDLDMVHADASQVEQIIMNLVVNARDAMATGGALTIETENVDLDHDYAASHVAVEPGPYVLMAISDTGVGMSREVQARIFEPFFTTKGQGKGTGLGLATVFGIVKQSKGNVWVYSEEGRGTTFKVYLPAMPEERAASLARTVAEPLEGAGETILVVEDEELVRNSAVRILLRAGYTVLDAGDAATAEALVEQHADEIRLLLTDVVMPNVSGPELASRLAARLPALRVVYMSGYTDDSIVHHGVLDKDVALIQKPFTRSTLLAGVSKALSSERLD